MNDTKDVLGRVLAGAPDALRRSYDEFQAQPVDMEMHDRVWRASPSQQVTLGKEVSVTGPGTFFGRARRTLTFVPSEKPGWYLHRTDLSDALPIRVCASNVWTTLRNIVLRSGSPHNYMRMVEHIIALKLGLRVDNVTIRMDSGDPPLFDRGSMDLVEAFDAAGVRPLAAPVAYWTVREPVSIGGPNGSFLVFRPCEDGERVLKLDCAVNFPTAIGRQRIRTTVDDTSFRHGAQARTNTTFARMLFTKTLGLLFADFRNLGYTTRNILIAGRHGYVNEAKLLHNGKSLEAVWHRAMMDLVAALALIDEGRLVGTVQSYKAGHTLDVVALKHLYQNDLFVRA